MSPATENVPPPNFVKVPFKVLPIYSTLTPVAFPFSPSAQPPLMAYVPVNCPGRNVPGSLKVPVKVATCPATDAEVRDMLPPVRVPVRPTVVSRSKQFEPLTCTAPLTEVPDTLILPAIVRGGVPATVDVVLNCQLLTALTSGGGGFEVAPEVGLEGEPVVLPPPHPESRRRVESHKMLAQCFMRLPPQLDLA